ncbi:unnamed protein product [Paramecium pentaurelia]|uniref:Uncharacterized protein n=1 Tax=Paramecium pentaurelia TaxID=43138 RepID=A0A8S1XMS9_9CILI|nr:unnamed protein product [Paramecium pentaurelia]
MEKTHPECQVFSPQCTTNGAIYIPITSYTSIQLKTSCAVGTDGTCGCFTCWKMLDFCIIHRCYCQLAKVILQMDVVAKKTRTLV